MGMFMVCAVCASVCVGVHGCVGMCAVVQGVRGVHGVARCGQVWPSVHR